MDSQGFLDAAIAAADGRGQFDSRILSKQLKLSRDGMDVLGDELVKMRLLATPRGRWQLLGVARDLADALHGRNVDRAVKSKQF